LDKIDLFVDHFVIHSESREALILNCSSAHTFKESLHELIGSEVLDVLLSRIKMIDHEIALAEGHRHVSPRHDRLVDARTALMDLHNDLTWNKETS
jgi:hypothetical protein